MTAEKLEDRHIGQGVPDDTGYGSLLTNQADVHADEGTREQVPLIARAGWHNCHYFGSVNMLLLEV